MNRKQSETTIDQELESLLYAVFNEGLTCMDEFETAEKVAWRVMQALNRQQGLSTFELARTLGVSKEQHVMALQFIVEQLVIRTVVIKVVSNDLADENTLPLTLADKTEWFDGWYRD